MMIDENRHLADNATLNKRSKVTSEPYTRQLPIHERTLVHLLIRVSVPYEFVLAGVASSSRARSL